LNGERRYDRDNRVIQDLHQALEGGPEFDWGDFFDMPNLSTDPRRLIRPVATEGQGSRGS
jgi:hypothetical protein